MKIMFKKNKLILILFLLYGYHAQAEELVIRNKTGKPWVYIDVHFSDGSSLERNRLDDKMATKKASDMDWTNSIDLKNKTFGDIDSIDIYEQQLAPGPKYTGVRGATAQNKIQKMNLVTISKNAVSNDMSLVESEGQYTLKE